MPKLGLSLMGTTMRKLKPVTPGELLLKEFLRWALVSIAWPTESSTISANRGNGMRVNA